MSGWETIRLWGRVLGCSEKKSNRTGAPAQGFEGRPGVEVWLVGGGGGGGGEIQDSSSCVYLVAGRGLWLVKWKERGRLGEKGNGAGLLLVMSEKLSVFSCFDSSTSTSRGLLLFQEGAGGRSKEEWTV